MLAPVDPALFTPVTPWPLPSKEECVFYHTLDLPEEPPIEGAWDIRGRFEQYVGNYPLRGKTVLDVGTASGFLAFNAEVAGATVTAVEARDAGDIRHLQWVGGSFHDDRAEWLRGYDSYMDMLKRSFWYAWHKLGSRVEVVYAPIESFPFWRRRFDVVMAGALLEHLSDPVTAIGNMAAMADEALLIPFTPVEDSPEQFMRTANDWSNPAYCYTWWTLSRGLYERLFDNLGFSVELHTATAKTRAGDQFVEAARPTLVATRRTPRP